MIRGTTPTFRLTIGGKVDLTKAKTVCVTLTQKNTQIDLSGSELEITKNTVACFLPQKQSLLLKEGESAEIQVNWTYEDEAGSVANPQPIPLDAAGSRAGVRAWVAATVPDRCTGCARVLPGRADLLGHRRGASSAVNEPTQCAYFARCRGPHADGRSGV